MAVYFLNDLCLLAYNTVYLAGNAGQVVHRSLADEVPVGSSVLRKEFGLSFGNSVCCVDDKYNTIVISQVWDRWKI